MPDHKVSPPMAPEYGLYREVVAVDSLPVTTKKAGLHCGGLYRVMFQVVPSGGANPTVALMYWSEGAGKFIPEHSPITKAGIGADTPFEFAVDANGRTLFLAVTTLAAGKVDIYASSSPSA